MSSAVNPISLIDRLLREQGDLTAVEHFSKHHDHSAAPAQAKFYRDLIPLTAPREGQQYAFEVDLDACTGCKACVSACHSLNGLDEQEMWRSVGLLVGGTVSLPVIQHVTTACHHCIEPACMEGCPVNAYEKDSVTGIVRHLDDQCIGCQYCILKCPYDVPKYHPRKGIVRKCDMCSDRLAVGEAPACAAACPNHAIRIRIVDTRQVIEDSETKLFLPGAPDPDYTLPTTHYKTNRVFPRNTLPVDYLQAAPQKAHLPLVVMLVLTQLSVGAFVAAEIIQRWDRDRELMTLRPLHALIALGLGFIALAASVLHLGRPLYAFRAIIGLRTSWLSREIVAFGLFALLATAQSAALWSGVATGSLGALTGATGLIAVFCSAMIYHDTRRPFWNLRFTGPKFALSTFNLGIATTLLTATIGAIWLPDLPMAKLTQGWGRTACHLLAAGTLVKVILAITPLRHLFDRRNTFMKRTARLAIGPLARPLMARLALGLFGGVLLPLLAARSLDAPGIEAGTLILASFVMTLGAEFLERYLFFTAVIAPKMPGGLGE
jgi:formate dehydrogenase iron-sulfur subunit